MGYSLKEFMEERIDQPSGGASVWSVPGFKPAEAQTRLILLSEFAENDDDTKVPPIVRFYNYRTAPYPRGYTYSWEEPGDPVHPDFDFNGEDPTAEDFNTRDAGLADRWAMYIFNISAYRALVDPGEPRTDAEYIYKADKKLSELAEKGEFTGVQRWEIGRGVAGDLMKIMQRLVGEYKKEGDPSVMTLKNYVYELLRKDQNKGPTQYFLNRDSERDYEDLPENIREAVAKGIESLPDLNEYVKITKYDPNKESFQFGGNTNQSSNGSPNMERTESNNNKSSEKKEEHEAEPEPDKPAAAEDKAPAQNDDDEEEEVDFGDDDETYPF